MTSMPITPPIRASTMRSAEPPEPGGSKVAISTPVFAACIATIGLRSTKLAMTMPVKTTTAICQ